MKNGCLWTIFHEFIVKSVGKFFSYQYKLETAVARTNSDIARVIPDKDTWKKTTELL